MKKDENLHWFRYSVPDILSENIPVSIDIKSSDSLEFYILHEEDFHEDISIVELRNISINTNIKKTNHFKYEDEFEPGKYIIVSYLRFETDHDIAIKFTLVRYIFMPILWLISLIFIILILICIVRIILLNKKKPTHQAEGYQQSDHRGRDSTYPYMQDYNRGSDPHTYDSGYSHAGGGNLQPHQPPPRYAPYSQPPRQPQSTYPPPRQPRGSYRSRHTQHMREPYGSPQPQPYKPVTLPCKCGEVIVINDPTRPLHIKCPRCGRHGVLEGTKKAPEDDIFY